MAKETTKAVAKADAALVAKADAALVDFFAAGGSNGFERVDSSCIAVNFLKIAQSNSPGCDQAGPGAIKGLSPGMFYSSVSQNVFGPTVKAVILGFFRNYCQYTRKDRKFVGQFSVNEFDKDIQPQLTQEGMNWYSADKLTEFVETYNYALILPDFPGEGLIFFPLVKTGIRHAKKWITHALGIKIPNTDNTAPIYACTWELSTARNQNDKGTWYTIGEKTTLVKNLGFVPVEMRAQIVAGFKQAKDFIERTRIDYSTAGTHESPDGDTIDQKDF